MLTDPRLEPLPPRIPLRAEPALVPRTTTPSQPRVLIVDDEETIRTALGRFLRSRGYEVEVAESGIAALIMLERQRFAVMVCDVRMPGMTGLEVVPEALQLDPDLAILMLSAVNDAPTATDALSHGAMDYLVKPIELIDLQRAVERCTHRRQLEIERRRVEEHIREEVALRTSELEKEKAALHALTIGVAETLINAMEAKDVYLRGHSQRVAEMAASMAHELGLDDDTVEHIRLAGRLHDVGKIGIREEVLNKPSSLTVDEFEHIKDHVRIGMEILAPLRHIGATLQFVQDHHEHWDGSGYPRALRGEEISLGGRILAAADAFDALTSKRAYRESMTQDDTIRYLEAHAGKLLDPRVFESLKAVVSRRKSLTFLDLADLGLSE